MPTSTQRHTTIRAAHALNSYYANDGARDCEQGSRPRMHGDTLGQQELTAAFALAVPSPPDPALPAQC